MSVTLPAPSIWAQVSPRMVGADGQAATSPTDGTSQLILRMGDRYAIDVQLPQMDERSARKWLGPWHASRTQAVTAVMPWPQPSFEGPLGSPTVNGAGQLGSSLAVAGLTPGIFIPALRFFSFVVGGRHYLHSVTADGPVNGSGQVTLSIAPMLRVSPADNSALDFVTPKIEGYLSAPPAWTLNKKRFFGASLTITENA